MFKPSAYRRTKIVLGVICLVFAVLFGFSLLIGTAVSVGYFPEVALRRPIVKYDSYFFFLYVASLLFGLIYSVNAWLRQKPAFPLLIPMVLTLGASTFYLYAYEKGGGDALSFKLAGRQYKVSWDYNPYAEAEERGSYLRVEAFYPGFKPRFPSKKSNETFDYLVSATRYTTPELICLNWIPCSKMKIEALGNSAKVTKIKADVNENLQVVPNVKQLQIKVIKSPQKLNKYTKIFLFQKNTTSSFDKFGTCWGNEYQSSCNYFFASGAFFYDIKIEPQNRKPVDAIPFEQDLPKIEAGIIKLFDTLIVK